MPALRASAAGYHVVMELSATAAPELFPTKRAPRHAQPRFAGEEPGLNQSPRGQRSFANPVGVRRPPVLQ